MNRLAQFLVLVAAAAARAGDTVYLDVGTSFKDSVDAYPEATVFVVREGEHRMQEVAPKSDNVFVGEQGAIMNGSRLLTDWSASGDVWVHAGQTQEGDQRGNCVDGLPRCDRPDMAAGWEQPINRNARLVEYTTEDNGRSWRREVLHRGTGTHQAVVCDVDNDGELEIVGKVWGQEKRHAQVHIFKRVPVPIA